jgi:hypothetical protein
VAGALGLLSSFSVAIFTSSAPASAAAPLSIQVQGNRLVNGAGTAVQLRGVNRDGSDYACVQGWGVSDGPLDDASVAAIASWHVNAVRIPLNEDCWLGINGINPQFGGANYQQAIMNYVSLLNAHGLYAILGLIDAAPGTTPANGLVPMADEDHSPAFWTSVASTFKNNPAVIFDLFGEPYPDSNSDTTAAWTCWRDGGTCPGVSYQAAGMQELVNVVRATGATNVLELGGIGYASVFTQWGTYEPTDPGPPGASASWTPQLVADFHNYYFGGCTDATCWDSVLGQINGAPLVSGETGFEGYIEPYMTWADAHGVGYLAWTWDTWGCTGGQALISDYTGTPCAPYGSAYQQHLTALATTPTRLVITAEPGGGTAGSPWSAQPTVTIENVDGNPVTSDSSPITLSIQANPGGGTLSQANPGGGTLSGCSATTVTGVATFSGCQIDKAAAGYTLIATDTADGLSATSDTFNIAAGAPAQLVFSVQPGGGPAQQAWDTQPTVTIEDANANTVTADTATITLSMILASTTHKMKLVGCVATTTAGVAAFSGCQTSQVGSSFALSATDAADSLTATSSTFSIVAKPHKK